MTAAIAFTLSDTMRARLDARDTAVDCARTIIRGKERHAPDDLRLACHTLMTYGNQWDWVEAYHVLRALNLAATEGVTRPPRLDAPPYSPQTRVIRRALIDAAGLAVILAACWALLRVGV